VVVDGTATARDALIRLRAGDTSGAVLAPDALAAPAFRDGDVGSGGRLRPHVRGHRPEVERVLDVLLAPAVVVDDWVAALDLAIAHPNTVVVTRQGDRFAGGRWRTGTGAAGATGMALDEARSRADEAEAAVTEAEARLAVARRELDDATKAETQIARVL